MTRTALVFIILFIFAIIILAYKIIGISLGAVKSFAILFLTTSAVSYAGSLNKEVYSSEK